MAYCSEWIAEMLAWYPLQFVVLIAAYLLICVGIIMLLGKLGKYNAGRKEKK